MAGLPSVVTKLAIRFHTLVSPDIAFLVSFAFKFEKKGKLFLNFTCVSGIGNEFRICLSNGLWSGEDPACDPVVCPVPEAPEHGSWIVGGFVPGSTIRFECQPGFTLVGSATLTCLTDKSWSDRPPSCQQITCPPLRDPEHGTVQLTRWISDNQELNNDINQQMAAG